MKTKLTSYIALGIVIIAILSAASCKRSSSSNGENFHVETNEPVVLEYLRLWDESDVLDEIIQAYQEEHSNVSIIVRKAILQPDETIYDYQDDLIKQIADDAGPDMFMIHNDWLAYHKNHLAPMPNALMTAQDYAKDYPQVVVDDFVDSNKIYAIPYYIDNLILFYNTTIFDDLKIRKPPRTWSEVTELIPKLTIYGPGNKIERSALAFGVADGISRYADILTSLIMQYGGEMTTADHTKATFNLPAPNSSSGQPFFSGPEALAFYTSFADPTKANYTYNDNKDSQDNRDLPVDVQAFTESKAAMFVGYAYQVENIKKFAPNLIFETAPLPQLRLENPVVLSNYWGEVVSKNSQYPDVAWDFINFAAKSRYNNKYARTAKRVPARKDLQESYIDRQYYGAVSQQIDFSKSWYRNNTPKVEDIFAQMINSVLHYEVPPATAIDTAVRDINQIN